MGNTCASIHIAWKRSVEDVTKAVSRAYGRLGYERVKKPLAEGGKHVILRAGDGKSFVSVYDSGNAALDSGELKDLALATSKTLKTAAVFTSLYDSDRYEFIVFANGRQVDFLMTDAESYSGPLKQLSHKSRATKWSALFGRTVTAEQIAHAAAGNPVFADSIVARLSGLIGLSGGQSQTAFQDFEGEPGQITSELYFKAKPPAVSNAPAGEIRFANAFDPDDSRMLLVYPAGWPIPVGKPTNVKWLILSQGAGFQGGTATIRVSGPDGPVLSKGAMRGFKFHNGQIVGDLETRPTDKDHVKDYYAFEVTPVGTAASGSQLYRAEFPNVDIPPMTPARTTQILIIVMLYDLQSQTTGEWEINVSLKPGAQSGYRYELLPMRIATVEQGWLPVVSGLNPRTTFRDSNFSKDPRNEYNYVSALKDKQSRVLNERQLVHPAISSSVAIHQDDGQATLDACKLWLEAWLRPLAEQRKGELRIHTEKKLPALVFKSTKSKKSLPITGFLEDKMWRQLFDYGNNYQSVLVSVYPEGSERPIAGIGLQYSHESHYFQGYMTSGTGYAGPMAKTLSAMRGRPFAEEACRSTLHAFHWVTNHSECYEYMATSFNDMGNGLDRFAAKHAPLQAWNSQCTWVPLFDQAAHGQVTLYERASACNWFAGVVEGAGLDRRLMSVHWCNNVLRMVTPHMWLGRNLMEQVNRAALEKVAEVAETNGACRIVLRSGCALDELELALLPILPVENGRIAVKG